ncbi:type I protein arginine methyltransferase [Malassezia obtusa]|uniref:Type I protein arginine methyltransferase n=1 Tax=Malassezia obtusa TaxID=76774 RepID=A0AAF0ISV0_9BASI|nr:type I protein arginine methyltransferase [Malassezia obtusa]
MLHGLGLLRQQYEKYAASAAPTPEKTIQTLAQKLTDAALAREDRRAALFSLKALTRDHAALVVEHALVPLLRWIKARESDEEMLRAAVESCVALCQAPDGARAQTQILAEPDALLALLALLAPVHAFYTRFAALQLLATLLEHHRAEVQERVLAAPGGCSAVLHCLEAAPTSSTEIIRNEALLLLPGLVSGSADIQKIIAFEGAFERLLDIIAQEGRIEGGVVVQDALAGLEALLRENASNQVYFRETLSVPLLAPLLFFPPPLPAHAAEPARAEYAQQRDAFLLQEWDEEKLANALLLVRCIRHLVDGHRGDHRENQRALAHGGLTECLVQLVFASLAPPLLKAHALHLLAAILRESRVNQELLCASVVTPVALVRRAGDGAPGAPDAPAYELAWQTPQPAMLCLVALALRGPGATERASQALAVRTAALAAFDALVAQNIDVRMTLLHACVAAPAPDQNHGNSNQLLLDAVAHLPGTSLVAPAASAPFDASQCVLACFVLSSLLHGSETTKEFARRIHLDDSGHCVASAAPAPAGDDAPATLLHLVVGNLAMATREHGEAVRRERFAAADGHASTSEDWTRVLVAYLVLLAHWLWQSSASVADLVSESANLQVVLQPVAQSHGVDCVVQGLAAFVLGELYEFNALTGDDDGVLTRRAMHPILHTRVGPDAFASRLVRLKSDPRFASVGPDVLEHYLALADRPTEPDVPPLWFTWRFVEFWKEHYAHVQKAILVEPDATSADAAQSSAELLDARQQVATLRSELQHARAEAALVDGLRADVAKAHEEAAAAAALREQLAGVRSVLDETKRALDEAHAQLAAPRDTPTDAHAERVHALEHELQETRDEYGRIAERVKTELARVRDEHADAARRRDELAAELARLREDAAAHAPTPHGADLAQARDEAAAELARTRDAHAAELGRTREEAAAELARTRDAHTAELARLRETHADELQRERIAHTAELARLREAHAQELARAGGDANLAQENEDLLVLLDELSTKHKRNKERMR